MEKSAYAVYFGSYTDKELPGIYSYKFDEDTEEVEFIESFSGLQDPTFLKISQTYNMLYTFTQSHEGSAEAAAVSYRIDAATGKLTGAQQQSVGEKGATHINTDQAERFLLTVSYGDGSISLLPLLNDGTIGELADHIQHSGGSGVVGTRQDTAHPHSIYTDPSDQFVIVPDLGLDKLMVYRLDRMESKLELHDEIALAPGAGPRHFAFHPNGQYGYVIEELSSKVTAFTYDRVNGKLQAFQTINTLPADWTGKNSTAEVQISPCGRYLYGSNRGHDSIVVFSIDSINGKLTLIQHISTSGNHPRNFSLSPSGRFLLAANKDSNSVYWFRVDPETGMLEQTGRQIVIPQPTCVKFYKLS